jgi:hypothetical protein
VSTIAVSSRIWVSATSTSMCKQAVMPSRLAFVKVGLKGAWFVQSLDAVQPWIAKLVWIDQVQMRVEQYG